MFETKVIFSMDRDPYYYVHFTLYIIFTYETMSRRLKTCIYWWVKHSLTFTVFELFFF